MFPSSALNQVNNTTIIEEKEPKQLELPVFNTSSILNTINQEENIEEVNNENVVNSKISEDNSSPLSILNSFQPKNDNILASITPAKFDGLLKVLNLLVDSNDPIVISNSTITKNLSSGAIVTTNIKQLFDQDINLHIVNPKKNIKLFKQFKNNNNIFIINDDSNSRYIVLNGEIRLFLPKQDENVKDFKTSMPNLEGVVPLAFIKIDKETKNIISELAREAEYIEYLFQESKLKAIHIPDTAIFMFEEFMKDENAAKLDETNAERSLRSTSFLPILAESYELNIGKLPDGSYCSYTICDTGFLKIDVFEELEETTGGSLF